MLAAALLLFVFGLYPLANTLSAGTALPWYRHALTFWVAGGGALLVVLFLLAVVGRGALDTAWEHASAFVMRLPWGAFILACACVSVALSAWIASYCFGLQPHNADEAAQLFHAKILLSGRLSLAPDVNPAFFQMDDVISGARWYSQFPVGGPAFLAIGLLIRAAWLLNPLLLGLSLVSTAAFTRRTYGEGSARMVAMLYALCPFALFMSASFMNHVPTMWLVSVALWQLARWSSASTARDANLSATLIGLSLGAAFAVRPLDALAAAAVIGLFQLTCIRSAPTRTRSLVAQVVAGLVPVAVLFIVNARTNGSATTLGYEILYGTSHQLGFHVDPYGSPHTPMRALLFASKYLLQLNVLLFEWPLPAVGIIIAGLVALRRPTRWDLLVVGLLLAECVAYALYWHDGAFRGPRFLFTALPAIVILVARVPFVLAKRFTGVPRTVAIYAIPACMLVSWLAYGINDSMPRRIRQYRSAALITRIDPDSLARAAGLHHALVFINEGSEARNLHLLVALGMNRGDAARLTVSASPCAVRQSIATEEARAPAAPGGRRDRLIRGALAIDPRTPEPQLCLDDARRDESGTAPYVTFFAANEINRDGRVDGDVIWALDMMERNSELRARFGDRAWMRLSVSPTGTPSLRAY